MTDDVRMWPILGGIEIPITQNTHPIFFF